MNEECNSQAGQLDLLWEQFGGRVVENNPNDARDSDMLNKQGVERFINQLTGGAIVGISKIDDPNDKRKNIVMAKTLNGESITLYSFEKEDYLKKVVIRKTTQQDVDDGNADKSGLYAFEYIMNSGRKILVPAYQFMYHGVRTDSIETYINENGGIESILRIAENKDTALTVEMTRNGLLIQSVVSPCQGQAKIVKQDCGLAVQNNWDNGDPIKLVELTYEEYVELQNASLACDCRDGGECVCEDNSNRIENGCIYFIKNKNIMYLNGVKYGFAISDSNTVYMTKSETGEFMLNVKISNNSTNMLKALSDGLYSAMSWSGSKSNEILEVQYDNEDVYKSLDESQKSRTIFICADSKRIYIAGNDYSYVDIIGNPDDAEDKNTVYGYINSKISELSKKVDSIGVHQIGVIGSFNDLEEAVTKPEICLKQSNSIIPFMVTSSEGKENGFIVNVITNNGINQALYWKNADKPSMKRTLSIGENGDIQNTPFYPIDHTPNINAGIISLYTLKGMNEDTDSDTVKAAFNDVYSKALIGVNELDKCLKYGFFLQDSLFRDTIMVGWNGSAWDMTIIGRNKPKGNVFLKLITVSISDDGIYKIVSPYKELEIITNGNILENTDIKNIVSELSKSVKYEDFELNGDRRKAIILENYNVLLGKMTNGSAVNLAMVSKWDKADYGSTTLPFNMNGSEERPTYNDTEGIALLKDITDMTSKLQEISDKVSAIESKNIDEAINSINQEIASIKERLVALEGGSN